MIEIRKISKVELQQLCELYSELIETATNHSKQLEVFELIEHNPNYYLLGAFGENQLLGSVMGIICHDLIGECKPFMVLENVVVSKRARRQGVGTKLMIHAEQIAKERSCEYMIFVSGDQRREAHIFYESLGFKEEAVEGYRKHFSK